MSTHSYAQEELTEKVGPIRLSAGAKAWLEERAQVNGRSVASELRIIVNARRLQEEGK